MFEPLLAPARYKGAHGGRGSAKSWFFAGKAIEDALAAPGEIGEGLNIVCIREIQKDLKRSSKSLIEGVLRRAGIKESDGFKVYDSEIRTPGDGVIIFQGMQDHTAESIKSLEGFHRAWWDEAQAASLKSMELLVPTIRWEDVGRGLESELWFSWNPTNEDDPVDVFLRKEPPEGSVVVQANWRHNPYFPNVLRKEKDTMQRKQPDRYLHVWEGEYRTISDAQILKRHRKAVLIPPANAMWHYGLDFGFANDPTAGLRVCVIDDTTLYVDAEVYEVGTPTERTPTLLAGLPDAPRWIITADSARPETIDYLRRHGFPRIRPSMKGAGSVEDGLAFLQGMEIVYHPNCTNLEYELMRYSYKIDKRTEEIAPVPEDRHNHLIDALRYATEKLHYKGRLVTHDRSDDDRPRRPTDYGSREDAESYRVV